MDRDEILLNDCYGGFDIPKEVIDKIFELYPPHKESGFYDQVDYPIIQNEEDSHFMDKTCLLVEEYDKYKLDYKYIQGKIMYNFAEQYSTSDKYITRGDNKVWFINTYNKLWRTHKDVIRLCKELGYIGKKWEYTKLYIGSIPYGYNYKIREYDGLEGLELLPPTASVLTDMIRIINTSNRDNLNPFTEKLIKGEISVKSFLNSLKSS
jgi:hypothetical protein